MTDPVPEARTLLWEWLAEADDPDPEQRAWKVARLGGMLDACERVGVLTADEVRRWRTLVPGEAVPSPPGADSAAAARHLEQLLVDLRPLCRDEDAGGMCASRRYDGALEALHAAGVLADNEAGAWRRRALEAQAPWLERDEAEELAAQDGLFAIGVPACTDEEAAADAAAEREMDAIQRRGELRRVLTCAAPARHEGLAVLAVVVRTEATELMFHHVGPPHGEYRGGFAELAAFSAIAEALEAPALVDDLGSVYEAVSPQPVSSRGTGGIPDPARPRVVTGMWRYAPAAPATATRFTATLGRARWTLE